jgi:hypothetical protein
MKYYNWVIYALFILLPGCNYDEKIATLLNSSKKNDIILGAYLAGESHKLEFVPLLLRNANDVRISTNIRFKGMSVYQEKMIALKKIFKLGPPTEITEKPDSLIINFYTLKYNQIKDKEFLSD